jgi:hypothetical protein
LLSLKKRDGNEESTDNKKKDYAGSVYRLPSKVLNLVTHRHEDRKSNFKLDDNGKRQILYQNLVLANKRTIRNIHQRRTQTNTFSQR